MRVLFRKVSGKPFLLLPMIIIFLLSLTLSPSYASGNSEASLAIGDAENALAKAFEGVLEAERAGGNVSDLIVKLDGAGRLLAEAENAYRVGDFSEAVSRAEGCSILANGVLGEASSLKSSALADAQSRFLGTVMFSLAGSVVFVAALVLIWLLFKPYYAKKLLKMKPEVASDVEA